MTYTPDGQIDTATRYADTAGQTLLGKTQYTYDDAGSVTQIEHTNAAGTVLLNFQYQYDAGDNLTSETDTVNGTPTTTNYSYDDANQLTSAGSNDYSYDANGNRTMTGYVDGAGNELQSDGVWNFKYDPAGNLIEKDGISNGLIWKYTWDNANQLLTATEYNSSGQLQEQETNFWDVFGNLIEQDQYVASTNTTTVTKFANQIMGLASGQQGTGGTAPVWADLDSSNQIQTRREYLDAIDAVFARIGSGGAEAWYLNDHLGSIHGLMNNSGALIDTIGYDAFGNITSESSPSNGDRYKFDGGQYDSMTDLELFGRRWYNLADGVWASQDLLGLAAGTNLYRYVGNDPTGAIDPLGERQEALLFTMVNKRGVFARQFKEWPKEGLGFDPSQWGFLIRFGADFNNNGTVKEGYAKISASKGRAFYFKAALNQGGSIVIKEDKSIVLNIKPLKVEGGNKVLVANIQFIIIAKGTWKTTLNHGVVSIETGTKQDTKINGDVTLKLKDGNPFGKYLVHIEFAEVDTGSGSYLLYQRANGDSVRSRWTHVSDNDADLKNGWIDMRELSFGPIRQFPGRPVTKMGSWIITNNSPWWEARPKDYNKTNGPGEDGSVTYPTKKE